jgi:hypothetical protein
MVRSTNPEPMGPYFVVPRADLESVSFITFRGMKGRHAKSMITEQMKV